MNYYNPEKPFTKKILETISQTWNGSVVTITGYPIIKRQSGYFIEHVDGIGTKGFLHWKQKNYENAAIDAFAMNINDLAILGFRPITINCHLLLQEENKEAIFKIISKLSELCQKYGIIFAGGETAILNTIQGMEIGVHMTGFTEKVINEPLKKGDLIYGHSSNGIHSNGLTLARKLLKDELNNSILDKLLKPTRIYADILHKTENIVKKRMHITGGAFTKLIKIINQKQNIELDLRQIEVPQIFELLYDKFVDNTSYEMLRTFNCGIGFIEIIDPDKKEEFESKAPESYQIGEIHDKGKGHIKILSPFDDSIIIYS